MSSALPTPEEGKSFLENVVQAAKEAPGNIVKAITGFGSTVASGVAQAETARVSKGKAVVTPEISKLALTPTGERVSSTQAAVEGAQGIAAVPLAAAAPLAVPYREFVARPLSAVFLAANQEYREDIADRTGDDSIFNPEVWGLAWRNAKFVSPGQAVVGAVGGNLIRGDQGTDKIDWTKENEVKDYFSRGPQKYVSFGLDFTSSFFLDPFYLTGRAAGAARRAYISQPVTSKNLPNLVKDIDDGVSGVANSVRANIDYIKANANNADAIESMKIVANSRDAKEMTKVFQQAGKLAIQTGDDSYIGDVLKLGIGYEPAREALLTKSPELMASVEKLQARKVLVDDYLNSKDAIPDLDNPGFNVPLGVKGSSFLKKMRPKESALLDDEIKLANQEYDFIYRVASSEDDSIVGAFQTQTWSPIAKIELNSLKNSLKFSDAFWGVTTEKNGVRVLRWFNPSMPLRERPSNLARISGTVSDRARLEARARVAQLGKKAGLTAKAQRAIYNTYFTTKNKAEEFKWFDSLEDATVVGIIKKRMDKLGVKPDSNEMAIIEEVGFQIAKKSRQFKRNTLIRAIDTNYTIDDGYGNPITLEFLKNYVDDLAQEIAARNKKAKPDAQDFENARRTAKDLLSDVPTTTSQIPGLHIAMDMDVFDDIIAENADLIKLIVDDIRLSPEDYAGKSPAAVVEDILDNRIGEFKKAEGAWNRTKAKGKYLSDVADNGLTNLYSLIWKPTTLMSFKYTSRNVTEGWMRSFAVAVEYARDAKIALSDVLGGFYEKGIIKRVVDNRATKARAEQADKIFQADYSKLNTEAKRMEKQISDLMFASSDGFVANVSDISKYMALVGKRYGNLPPVQRTPFMDNIIREFTSIPQRFADSGKLKDTESVELFNALASGDLKLANAILLSSKNEQGIFKTLEVVQSRLREQSDRLQGIADNWDFKNQPTRLQDYVNGTIDSIRNVDESLQNIAQAVLTRASTRGKIEELIVGRSLFNKVKASGQDEFEIIPGLKMSGYRQGVIGQIMDGEISAANNNVRTILDSTRLVDSKYIRANTKETIIDPTDPNWAQAAADFANRHMNDNVARRFMSGEDVKDIVKWARSSAPDAKEWRALKRFDFDRYRASGIKDPLRRFVEEIQVLVNNILPRVGIDGEVVRPLTDDAGKLILDDMGNVIPGLRQLAYDGKLTPEDMLTIPEKQRASVVGNTILENVDGSTLVSGWKSFVDKVFKYIGTLPEDNLVRHPFYNMVYKAEGKRQAKLLQAQGYTAEQIERKLPEIQINSHKFAYKMLMERLYSIERYTDPGYTMRFISPFYMAKQNSNRFWFGYAIRNPQAASRYFLLYQAPTKVFSVEDEDGRPIKTVNPFDAQDVSLKVNLPAGVARFFGKDISKDAILSTPISSFDLINNGYLPFVPEAGGPVIDVAAASVLNTMSGKPYDPELFLTKFGVDPEFLRKKLFPYYKSQEGLSKGDVLLSIAFQPNSWMRSIAASNIPLVSDVFGIADPNANERYNKRVIKAYEDFYAEWDTQRYIDNPTNPAQLTDEVRAELLRKSMAAATQMSFAEAIFSGLGYVAAPKFVTKQEELRKDLRLYQQEAVANGGTEDDGLLRFVKENGFQRAAVAQYTPREANPYGFLSTPQTVNNLNKHSGPFSRAYLNVGETKVAGAMLNAGDPVTDYSIVANSKLYSSSASGIGEVKKKLSDPEAMAREIEINQGFKLQFAYKDYYDAAVAAGTMSQKEADAAYKNAKKSIAVKYPAYKSESGEFNSQKAQNNVKAIFKFIEDPAYVNDIVKNNELQGAVYRYMVERRALVEQRLSIDANPDAQIDSAKFNGVSANRDNLVRQISAEVPEFANFYKYYLENDPLSYSGKIARLK